MNVIDADGHILETDAQLVRYRGRAYSGPDMRRSLYPRDEWDRRFGGKLGALAHDAEAWLKALDEGGVDSTVLYPTAGLFLGFVKDPDWTVALSKAYNAFLHHEVLAKSPRIKAVALLPVQNPREAASELRRAVLEYGFVGGMLVADVPHLLGQA